MVGFTGWEKLVGVGIWGLKFRVLGAEDRGLGFRVQGYLGFSVQGLRLPVNP